ncbi:hypothetical protein TSAR_006157 [Trichomalopsis sarcophagae]|uniref:Uncharacterized protein n=1 Tax=Trichomalopsis sarcophagae TaxID=543379 RepID=A0A232F0Q0_9HYME|nr:hypothetical protein TSAR_006157 [Trichomalopsis sarcophagae]
MTNWKISSNRHEKKSDILLGQL